MMALDPPTARVLPAALLSGCSLRLGDVLASRYRLESVVRVDAGTGGDVALATALRVADGSRVLVDLVPRATEGADDAAAGDARLALLTSARRAMELKGRRAARVLDAGVTPDGAVFVVREPSSPPTLASVLATYSSLSTEQAVDIALDVCEALAEAHARRLVHGCLTPACVTLGWSPDSVSEVKVMGLGVQRHLARLGAASALVVRAPEQLDSDEDVDDRTDVWGLGSLLYTMLAGAAPFSAETPSTVNLAIVLDEPASLAGVPDELADLVDACLAKNPVLRPSSISVLASRLAPFGSARSLETLERIRAFDHVEESADDTARREAIVAEMLASAAARASAVEIPVDIEPSVRDVTLPPPSPPGGARQDESGLARPARRSWRSTGAATAAACVTLGIVIGIAVTLVSSRKHEGAPASAVAAAAAAPPPVATTMGATSSLSDAPALTPIAASALANAPPTTAPHKVAPRASSSSRGAATGAAGATGATGATAAHASTVEAPVDPLVRAAAEPPAQPQPQQPQPAKASDDDLRRFLDDRR